MTTTHPQIPTSVKAPVISPAAILQTGLAFWSSKVLLTAVNLDLFTVLGDGSQTAEEISAKLGLQNRGLYDFLDTLVALRFLYREGKGENALYCNTLETEIFLDRKKPSYVGGILTMANNRLYPFWNNLEEALKTGKPQNEAKDGSEPLFETLYADEKRLELFMDGMTGVQLGNFIAFSKKFNFAGYKTHCDIGGCSGILSSQIVVHQPHMQSVSFDLAPVAPIAQRQIDAMGVQDKVSIASGDFFRDPFPKADLITMGNILHDWDLETKKMLISKAYEALPQGGAFVVIENIIDDERRENAFGLMMSLNMLIETEGGFDYTKAEFIEWTGEAGFTRVEAMHLTGPTSALIAYK
ncbi:MAG: methyltransferase [Williamsia sp.]|nr:methyltransferase [Williamsia sp.]